MFQRRLSSVLALAANAAYCFSHSIFTSYSLNKISRCSSAGGGGTPRDAFGYPNAMLAKPVTGWERKKAEAFLLRLFDIGFRFNSIHEIEPAYNWFGRPEYGLLKRRRLRLDKRRCAFRISDTANPFHGLLFPQVSRPLEADLLSGNNSPGASRLSDLLQEDFSAFHGCIPAFPGHRPALPAYISASSGFSKFSQHFFF